MIVLDEMNLARIEYYFAEMLSVLEMPSPRGMGAGSGADSLGRRSEAKMEGGKIHVTRYNLVYWNSQQR